VLWQHAFLKIGDLLKVKDIKEISKLIPVQRWAIELEV